jgi:hypothetical protein
MESYLLKHKDNHTFIRGTDLPYFHLYVSFEQQVDETCHLKRSERIKNNEKKETLKSGKTQKKQKGKHE